MLVSGSHSGYVTIWRVTDNLPMRILWGYQGKPLDLEFSPDGRSWRSSLRRVSGCGMFQMGKL